MPLRLVGMQRELPHRSPEPVSLKAVQWGKVAAVLTAARQSHELRNEGVIGSEKAENVSP